MFDGTTITQITDNAYDDKKPKIGASKVVFASYDGTDDEISVYDIETDTTTQATDNNVDEYNHQVSGSNVVWESIPSGETDSEIYYHDTEEDTTTQITDNDIQDTNPMIVGSPTDWGVGWNEDDWPSTGDYDYNDLVFRYDLLSSPLKSGPYSDLFDPNANNGIDLTQPNVYLSTAIAILDGEVNKDIFVFKLVDEGNGGPAVPEFNTAGIVVLVVLIIGLLIYSKKRFK